MAEWEKEVKTRCEEYDKYLTSAAEELKLRKCSHCQANMYPNYLTCPACGKETPITAP